MIRRSRPVSMVTVVVFVLAGLVAASCGTRLPDEAFDAASGGGDGAVQAGARGSASGTGSGGGAVGDDGTGALAGGGLGDGSSAGGGAGAGAAAGDAGAGGGGGASGGGGAGGGAAGAGSAGAGAGGANTASDVGVTPSEIRVGNITDVGGPFGPETFGGMLHGAQAYFQALNERGGVNGRKVRFSTCDDRSSSDRNNACAESLIEQQKVFALVANSTVTYAAARYVDSKGVPDVGGQPVGNAYYKYPRLFSILGVDTPRNGKDVGDGGKLYSRTGTYRYFKQNVKIDKAAVFFYVIPVSRSFGMFFADGMRREGIDVVYYGGGSEAGINPAAPTYDTDVIQMRNRGVQGIWNVIDIAGFQKLCQAMDRYAFRVKANISTVQGMSQKVGEDFSAPCRNDVWSVTYSKGYQETSDPAVAQFRAGMKKFDPGFRMHQWALEGWAAGKIFTDGVARMGASPTRKGLIDWLNSIPRDTYDVGGLFFRPVSWQPLDYSKPLKDCFSLHQWQDSAGSFVLRARECPVTASYFYTPSDDGS